MFIWKQKLLPLWLVLGLVLAVACVILGLRMYAKFESRSTSAGLRVPISASRDPQTPLTKFCEILARPSKSDQKSVRTLATATVSFENTFLYDLGCYKKDDLVWFEAADEQVAAKLSEILVIGVTYRARLDLTGKFEVSKSGGFGHVNGYRYQFVITHVNRVESIPANELWPYELKTSSK